MKKLVILFWGICLLIVVCSVPGYADRTHSLGFVPLDERDGNSTMDLLVSFGASEADSLQSVDDGTKVCSETGQRGGPLQETPLQRQLQEVRRPYDYPRTSTLAQNSNELRPYRPYTPPQSNPSYPNRPVPPGPPTPPVPEPATILMLGLVVSGLAGYTGLQKMGRRKK